MKFNLVLFLFLSFFVCNSQISNRLFAPQNFLQEISPDNFVYTIPPADNRFFVANINYLRLKTSNITGIKDTIRGVGDIRYKSILYSPSSAEITSALGYSPISAESDPVWNAVAMNYRTKLQNDILYQPVGSYLTTETDPLFNTKFSTKTTSNLNEGTNLYYTDTRSRNAISAGSGINYNATTGVIANSSPSQVVTLTAGNRIAITGTYPNFTISYVEPTINTGVVRALNSNFTVSATKQALVTYTLTCSVTNPLLVGTSTAMAYLEYSTNGGTTWLLPSQNGNSSGVGITVTLQLTNGQTGTLIGYIPANALVRIRTSTTGTGSVTYVTGQENY